MKIRSVHQREYPHPVSAIAEILETLSSPEDRLWPGEFWPPLKLNNGLAVNSAGGHGPIRYYVSAYESGRAVEFTFTRPAKFSGIHKFEILPADDGMTALRHTVDMEVDLKTFLVWQLTFRWLHDALLEDCLDKVQNQVSETQVRTPHSMWVDFLRNILRKKKGR